MPVVSTSSAKFDAVYMLVKRSWGWQSVSDSLFLTNTKLSRASIPSQLRLYAKSHTQAHLLPGPSYPAATAEATDPVVDPPLRRGLGAPSASSDETRPCRAPPRELAAAEVPSEEAERLWRDEAAERRGRREAPVAGVAPPTMLRRPATASTTCNLQHLRIGH